MNTGIISTGIRISDLPIAGYLSDGDISVVVQGGATGVTKQIDVSGNKIYLKSYFDTLYAGVNYTITGNNYYNIGNFTGSLYYKSIPVLTGIVAGTNITVANNSDGTFTINSSTAGTKTYAVFTADDNMPPSTGYTNYDLVNDKLVLSFAQSGDSYAIFGGIIPESAILTGGLKTRLHWNSITTGKNVRWKTEYARNNTNIGIDSYDTASLATATTSTGSNFTSITEIISTNIDGITAGDSFFLRIGRIGSDNINDTMITGLAQLSFIEVRGV